MLVICVQTTISSTIYFLPVFETITVFMKDYIDVIGMSYIWYMIQCYSTIVLSHFSVYLTVGNCKYSSINSSRLCTGFHTAAPLFQFLHHSTYSYGPTFLRPYCHTISTFNSRYIFHPAKRPYFVLWV